MLATTRRGISYPNPDRSDRADIALHIGNIATAADADVIFNQGTDAARIAAAHQSGGGRFWWTTDTALLWYDDGATWRSVAPTSSTAGLLAARPAANSLVAGSTFFATDQIVDYVTDGAAWIRKSVPAGLTADWFKPDAAVPAGWVLYDGSNLPAASGIYADLYAHLGNTLTKPDTRGRHTVGVGTNGDVSGVGVSDGLAVGSRTPKHNSTNAVSASHNLSLPQHGHGITLPNHNIWIQDAGDVGAGGQMTHVLGPTTPGGSGENRYGTEAFGHAGASVDGVTSTPAVNGSVTIGGTVGPGGTRPTDTSAYIACSKIGKL